MLVSCSASPPARMVAFLPVVVIPQHGLGPNFVLLHPGPLHRRRFRNLKSRWFGETSALRKLEAMRWLSQSVSGAAETRAGLEEVSHNQVLLAAVTASLLGQILKPFTSALQGKGFNWKLAVRPGGMPSTHSAFVTAACTALALERGLADSLFGLSVVYAGIVMYDAQGVRRAVGKQAEVINTLVLRSAPDAKSTNTKSAVVNGQYSSVPDGEFLNRPIEIELESSGDSESSTLRLRTTAATTTPITENKISSRLVAGRQIDGLPGNSSGLAARGDNIDEESGAYVRSEDFFELAKNLPSVEAGQVSVQELGGLDGWRHIPLKESVGHTKVEVLVGGLWGIVSTMALSQFLKIGP